MRYSIMATYEEDDETYRVAKITVDDYKDAKLDVLAYLQTISTVPILTNLPERHLDNYLTNRDNLLHAVKTPYRFKDIDIHVVRHLHTFAHHIYDQMDDELVDDSSVEIVEQKPPPTGYDVNKEKSINDSLVKLVNFITKCREKECENDDENEIMLTTQVIVD